MERTTVYLDAELKRRLKAAAARGGRTEAAMIREALAQYLASEAPPALRPVGHSDDGGVARDADAALEREGFGTT
jgi:plasmid stability protein